MIRFMMLSIVLAILATQTTVATAQTSVQPVKTFAIHDAPNGDIVTALHKLTNWWGWCDYRGKMYEIEGQWCQFDDGPPYFHPTGGQILLYDTGWLKGQEFAETTMTKATPTTKADRMILVTYDQYNWATGNTTVLFVAQRHVETQYNF